MAKTNFTKAEEALAKAMEQMQIEDLLERADKASGKPSTSVAKERLQTMNALKRDLRRLQINDPGIFKKLGFKKKDFNKLLENIAHLTEEEWDKIIVFKNAVDKLIKELPKQKDSNEKLIEDQRHRHITKRFNVSEKWLPLQ